jgi:hypothetical protein
MNMKKNNLTSFFVMSFVIMALSITTTTTLAQAQRQTDDKVSTSPNQRRANSYFI